MKTPYRKSYKGITAQLYSKIRERCKRKGWAIPMYDLASFRSWFEENGGRLVYNTWVISSWKKDLVPSVDRIDVKQNYYFKNMQVITAKENRDKGDKEKIILWAVPIRQLTLDGKLVKEYPNIKSATEETGINRNNISSVLHGKRKKAGGFKWEIIGNVHENPELLK